MHKYLLKIKHWIAKAQLKWITNYKILVFIVILLTLLTRFYNFSDRWGIGADNGRDALIALEALRRHELPLMGPFSSAGAFVTGGIYYWLIMVSYVLFPLMNAPWLMTGLVSILSVVLLMYLGKILVGNRFSIILGILSSLSPVYIGTAIELGNPTFVTVFTILNLIFFVLLLSKKRLIFAFLSGLSIGLAVSMHYQALNLLIFLFALFFITKLTLKDRIRSFMLMAIGVLIVFIPLLFWDSRQGFANTRNIMDYFLIGQYRIYVPNSWRLFLFFYLPAYWGRVVGGFPFVGLILLFLSMISIVFSGFKKRFSLPLSTVGVIFFILLIINKFYKGERSDGYMLYLAPFILIFTAYFICLLLDSNRKILKVFSIIILIFLIYANYLSFRNTFIYKNSISANEKIAQILMRKFPNEKFSVYDYKHENYRYSMPLSLLLRYKDKIDYNGRKIGIYCKLQDCPGKRFVIVDKPIKILDISRVSSVKLDPQKGIWVNVNPASVYDGQVGWLNKNQLKSTFSLKNYIMDKIRLL